MNPAIERVNELLAFNPETGAFTWRVRRGARKAGSPAGGRDHGYIRIPIDGRLEYAHRLAWAITRGEWPAEHIDHVNGDKADNRIANLREATNAENCQNIVKPRTTNALGVLGVYRSPRSGKYVAQIVSDGVLHHLGSHDTAAKAHAAYLAAKDRLHPFAQPIGRAS